MAQILYALVGKDRDVVLAEFTDFSGNFQQLCRQLMLKLKPNARQTFEHNKNNFHTVTDGNLIFLCMTDGNVKIQRAMAFLESMKEKFYNTFTQGQITNAIAFGLPFTEEIKRTMVTFNNRREEESMTDSMLKDLQSVKDTMVENLSKILERDVKINVVLSKSRQMEGVSATYKTHAVKYRRMQKWRYIRYWLLGFVILCVLIFFICVIACGGFTFKKCRS